MLGKRLGISQADQYFVFAAAFYLGFALRALPRRRTYTTSWDINGAYAVIPTRDERATGYTQLFRQGYFEAVWVLSPFADVPDPVLPGVAYEDYLNRFLGHVRGELDRHGLRWDMAVFLSLLGADRVVFAGPSDLGFGSNYYRFDRQSLFLPDVLISAEVSPGRGMRPAYDLMCQSAGMEGSANYGEDGEWKAAR